MTVAQGLLLYAEERPFFTADRAVLMRPRRSHLFWGSRFRFCGVAGMSEEAAGYVGNA